MAGGAGRGWCVGPIPGQGTKISHAVWYGRRKERKRKKERERREGRRKEDGQSIARDQPLAGCR